MPRAQSRLGWPPRPGYRAEFLLFQRGDQQRQRATEHRCAVPRRHDMTKELLGSLQCIVGLDWHLEIPGHETGAIRMQRAHLVLDLAPRLELRRPKQFGV